MMDIYVVIIFFWGMLAGGFLDHIITYLEEESRGRLGRLFDMRRHKLRGCEGFAALVPADRNQAAIQLAAGTAFAALYHYAWGKGGTVPEDAVIFSLLAFIFSALIVIFIYDLRHYIIPDKVVFPAIGASFLLLLSDGLGAEENTIYFFLSHIGAASFAGGFFLFLIWITRGKGMGGGDVKLGFLMGMVLGFWETLLALFIAFFSGALIGSALIALHKKSMESALPFGPFLILGFVLSFFYGKEMIDWYGEMLLV